MTADNTNNDKFPTDMPIPKRTWKQRLAAFAVILVIIAVGASVAGYLMKTRPKAKKKPPQKMLTLVTAETVSPVSTNVTVKGLGRIVPAREITLQARVSGTVEYLHPQFIPGGILTKDEVVVRLDAEDYHLAMQRKQNVMDQALADLRIEEGNQIVARQEWALINQQGDDIDKSSMDLALRQPQLEKVIAAINAARTDLERARIDLDRTIIKAPFNAIVREKKIDLGSQVSSQSAIAVLTGTDTFWAEISLPVDKLDWIIMPKGNTNGSSAGIYAEGNTPYHGKIVRLMPDIDQDGLMARLLIALNDPMGIKNNRDPLLLGSFIRAEITGKKLNNVFRIPRAALKEDSHVLTVTDEKTLHIQPVSIAWKNTDYVFVNEGLQTGDRIIVSSLSAPVEGMPLALPDTNAQPGRGKMKENGNEGR